jgi:hypothetical protein
MEAKPGFKVAICSERPGTIDRRGTEAEESLMSIGLDAQGSESEMGKMPAKAVTKQFT